MSGRLPKQNEAFDTLQVYLGTESGFWVNGDEIFAESEEEWMEKHEAFQFAWSEERRAFDEYVSCPFCGHLAQRALSRTRVPFGSVSGEKPRITARVRWCNNCLHWRLSWYEQSHSEKDQYTFECVSQARLYTTHVPDGCAAELAQAIRRDPGLFHRIHPTNFEKFIADVWRANYKECEVFHVGQPTDGGVDVVFIDDDSQQWLIQVKRREKPKPGEGVETVRNLVGALVLNDSLRGIVVSTADHFTSKAIEAADTLTRTRYKVELYDKGKLNRMLGAVLPEAPWKKALENEELCYPAVAKRLNATISRRRQKSETP
jgi:hypothetical protein